MKKIPSRPSFSIDQRLFDYINQRKFSGWSPVDPDQFIDWELLEPKSQMKWKELLAKIPSLSGEVYRGEIIARGHKIEPVKLEGGQTIRVLDGKPFRLLFDRWFLQCSCGYKSKTFDSKTDFSNFVNNLFYLKDHIDMTKLEPMTYVRFSYEWLEDMSDPILESFLEFLIREKAILIREIDTRSYILVDDDMSDAAVLKLKEFLAGNEVSLIEMRVLRS